MTNPNDPTFPEHEGDCNGLTKREHFAAMAMQGLLACPLVTGNNEQIAKYARAAADALIAELNK